MLSTFFDIKICYIYFDSVDNSHVEDRFSYKSKRSSIFPYLNNFGYIINPKIDRILIGCSDTPAEGKRLWKDRIPFQISGIIRFITGPTIPLFPHFQTEFTIRGRKINL